MTTEANEGTENDFAAFEQDATKPEAAEAGEDVKKEETAPAAEAAEPAPAAEDDGSTEGDDDSGDPKPEEKKNKPSDRIRELSRKNRELMARLDAIENRLPAEKTNDTPVVEDKAPDPSDSAKYPLGALDDRYIEDKLEWLADQKATKQAETVLQREQERDSQQAAQRQQQELLTKVDNLATKGTELFEDFQESVVEAGMRGDWDLSQPTFEAAHDAEHGAQILYDLAQDKAEASRVAKLSPYQQLKYVAERDAEISKAKSGRKIPKAGDPPTHTARGANSRTQISGATDNLDDFEKAWEADAKRGR